MWRGFSLLLGGVLLGLLLLSVGCNSRDATYPVSGTVRFEDGQPVPHGNIEFRNEESGISARSKLSNLGAYSLETFSADDGAPAGKYRVIVTQFFNVPPASAHVRMDTGHQAHSPDVDIRVAEEVSDFSTSPLQATVRPDAKNEFDFVVNRYVPNRRLSRKPPGE
jgi:hypothetical protein